jgi:6-phospho-beta-glucosidase
MGKGAVQMLKISVIGGGSTYTPELINGFIENKDALPIDELWLMDVLPDRLEIVGSFAQRMVAAAGNPFQVILTTDQSDAIRDSAYVITQFRVGQMQARINDEYLGKRHNLIGQETTGIGGMAKALRTIPVIEEVVQNIRTLAPTSLLLNFTNPAGLITEAVNRFAPDIRVVGLCNSAYNAKMDFLESLGQASGLQIDPNRAQIKTLGLNHLTWYLGFSLDENDMWGRVFESYLAKMRSSDDPAWDPHTLEVLGMIPNSYLQYYYYTDRKLEAQNNWPPSRGEQVLEIENQLLREYAEPERTTPPERLMQRGGAYYSTVATKVIKSHYNDLNEEQVVNVRNGGAVPDYALDWILELPARIGSTGISPVPTRPLPPSCYALVAAVKSFELLTIEAALNGSRKAAYEAMLAHPLGPPADQIQAVLEDLLETNREYLPQFFE